MRNKKNIVIGILCLTLVFMGIGYSLFSTTLNITGSSQGSGSFDVKITNVELNDKSTGATNTTPAVGNNYAVTETTLSAEFNAPGDYITYDITVTNRGSIDAVFQVGVNPQTDTSSAFNMSCNLNEGTELLANGGYKTFQCTMIFDENRTLTSMENIAQGNMTITISAVQKAGYTPPTPTVANECFLSFREGEINDYLISNPNCSANVVIPDNLALGVREVTSMEFDDAKCSQFESALTSLDENYTCTNLKAQFNSIKTNPQVVYNTFLGQLSITTYGEEGLEKHPIKKIGDGVFTGKQITGVTIGEGIETIGLSSFGFNSITSVTLPSTLKVIGDSAFINNGITSLTLPRGLTTIGVSAFEGNAITGTLTIPNTVTSIGNYAFSGRHSTLTNHITSLSFENNSHLQAIGKGAFVYNQLSGTLTIPKSVTSIGDSAFEGSSDGTTNQITSLVFESGSHLQTIGDNAFRDNALTGTLTIPSSITSIGNYAFHGQIDGSTNQITSISFGNNSQLQTIGNSAFEYNALTGTLTIPASVTSIGSSAFYGSSAGSTNQITSISFGNNSHLQTIGNSAFGHNKISGTLTIPASVTSIGSSAFYGSSAGSTNQITSLVFESGSHLETINSSAFMYNKLSGTLTIPSSVTSIGGYAFRGSYGNEPIANQITSLVFENGSHLQTIGDAAFAANTIIGALTIPSTVTSIGSDAFSGNQITTLSFENNSYLQTIGSFAFNHNQISGTMTIPSTVTSIEYCAFNGNSIEELHLGAGITYIGALAFSMTNHTLTDVYVDMTETDWQSNVTKGSSIFDSTPTMHYSS